MTYQAIARRWRPSRFEDVVGQEAVVQTLKNTILLDRTSHAYLFCGSRGVGKTTIARVFAKALRCPQRIEATPCNQCPECLAIGEGRSIDVIEIDGASNNGVESIRSIRDNVAYGASSGTYKIYIIDEAHMLSLSAFNALLKTLEEPPPHVIFILATTEAQKVPVTILSRCQRFEFKRLPLHLIQKRVQEILEVEKIQFSEKAAERIASHSEGSLRDALSLLDQVLSLAGEKALVSDELVNTALGSAPYTAISEFWTAILNQEVSRALSLIHQIVQSGANLKNFTEKNLDHLRAIYLTRLSKENRSNLTAQDLDLAPSLFDEIQKQAEKKDSLSLERMAQIFLKTSSQIGWVLHPQLLLEMTAVRLTQIDQLNLVQQAEVAPEEAPRPEARGPIPVASTPPPTPPPPEVRPSAPPIASAQPEGSNKWKGLIDQVMKKRPLLGALLCHAEFQLKNSTTVQINFPEGTFYERQAKEDKNRKDILDNVQAFMGPQFEIQIGFADEASIRSIEKDQQDEINTLKKEMLAHPAVLKAQEILKAEVVDVKVTLDN